MKRIILNFDGTWQTGEQDNPTNIKLIHDSIDPVDNQGIEQLTKHFDGVGTSGSKLKKIWAGVTGSDVKHRIKEAYKYLIENYEPGDEVILTGFSRGAFTARTLNGMIYKCGILKNEGDLDQRIDKAYEFYQEKHKPNSKQGRAFRDENSIEKRPETTLACFDTVGALGVPAQIKNLGGLFNRRHKFHDTRVNRNTKHAFHIAAIDEHRKNFQLTPMKSCEDANTKSVQLWCVGNHSAVGGGSKKNRNKPISDVAGLAMVDLLKSHTGLSFNEAQLKQNFSPDPLANQDSDFKQKGLLWKIAGLNDTRIIPLKEIFDFSVLNRWENNKDYRPRELKKFAKNDAPFPSCSLKQA